MTTIFSPTFAEAVSVFPRPPLSLPEGALSFYMESNLFFAAASKDFIRAIEKQEDGDSFRDRQDARRL